MIKPIKFIIIILLTLLLASLVSADSLTIGISPLNSTGQLQPNTNYAYTWNFTSDINCTNVLQSNSQSITTNAVGRASVEINITNLNSYPTYLCEYRNGTLRTVLNISSQIVNRLIVNNIEVNKNITPQTNNTSFLGSLNRMFSSIYSNTIYEGGQTLSSVYATISSLSSYLTLNRATTDYHNKTEIIALGYLTEYRNLTDSDIRNLGYLKTGNTSEQILESTRDFYANLTGDNFTGDVRLEGKLDVGLTSQFSNNLWIKTLDTGIWFDNFLSFTQGLYRDIVGNIILRFDSSGSSNLNLTQSGDVLITANSVKLNGENIGRGNSTAEIIQSTKGVLFNLSGDGQTVSQDVDFTGVVNFFNNVTLVSADALLVNESMQLYDRTGTTQIILNASSKRVGIGTITPTTALDVRGNISTDGSILTNDTIYVNKNTGVAADNILLKLSNFGGSRFDLENSDNGVTWRLGTEDLTDSFIITKLNSGFPEFEIDTNGTIIIGGGDLNISGSLNVKANTGANADFIFATDSQDWKIRSTLSNGRLSFVDVTNNLFPFKLDAGAPDNALVIATNGVGLGTNMPVSSLDVRGNQTINDSLGVGTTTPDFTSLLHVVIDNTDTGRFASLFDRYTDNAGAHNFYFRKARGSEAAPTAVQNDDNLISINADGYNGSVFRTGSVIRTIAQNVANGVVEGEMQFELSNATGDLNDVLLLNSTSATFTVPITNAGDYKQNNMIGTYSNGEAYVCVWDNGTIFAKDSACN